MPGSQRYVLTARELMADPLFAGVPPKFLLWQQGLAVRWQLRAGEILCRQGDPGNTAYLIRKGRLKVTSRPAKSKKGGAAKPAFEAFLTPADRIAGEMACLGGTPRMAEVSAAEDSEGWEIRRNLLDRMMRSPQQRATFERLYRDRALGEALRQSELFRDQPDNPFPQDEYAAALAFLQGEKKPGVPRLSFVRVNQGQLVFEQGDWAEEFYLVRLGNVKVTVSRFGGEGSVIWCAPGSVIGEISLLALSADDTGRSAADVDREVLAALNSATGDLSAALPAGRRTATCSALDPLELARVQRSDFLEMVKRFPTVRRRLIESSLARLKRDIDPNRDRPLVRQYVSSGLYQAQNLLAMDLTKCTHCDECTKACADKHGTESHGIPVTRLLRDGIRLGQFLVATSCRSCKDAYCMKGCPVDAIHRGKHLQIVIEDHCIGCGLCATNCPYGNIWMVPNERRKLEVSDPDRPGHTEMRAQPKAATCDLCDADGDRDVPLPRCVHACPHDAAHRMTGEQLLAQVQEPR
jgi:CRP-like cAMP-binding protein/Fe-S-cluster-containing hydrogenase component 2